MPSMFDDAPPPPPIYPLQQFRFTVFIYLREFVWDLCLGMQYSLSNTAKQTTGQKYVAAKPFGVARLQLFEIVYETLKKFPRSLPKVLENIPWKMLVNWFFEYKFNTRYLVENKSEVNVSEISKLKIVDPILVEINEVKGISYTIGTEEIEKVLFNK